MGAVNVAAPLLFSVGSRFALIFSIFGTGGLSRGINLSQVLQAKGLQRDI